ncbi:MAG: FkbM family methyltransferase, partial [Alphaproteobacteria bacterium]
MTYGLLRSAIIYYGQPLKRRRTVDFYRQFIRPGDLCFDIGAHIGGRISTFQRLKARIVALEPQPAFMAVLRHLYDKKPDIVLLQDAVGSTPGRTTMLISDWTPTVSTLDKNWADQVGATPSFSHVRWNKRLEVEVVT